MKSLIKILKPTIVSSLVFSSIAYASAYYDYIDPPIDPDIGITPVPPPKNPIEASRAPAPPAAPAPPMSSSIKPIVPALSPSTPPVIPVAPVLPAPERPSSTPDVKKGETVSDQFVTGSQYVYGISNSPIISQRVYPDGSEGNGKIHVVGGIVNNVTALGGGRLYASGGTINGGILSEKAEAIFEGAHANDLNLSGHATVSLYRSEVINTHLTDSAIQIVGNDAKTFNTTLNGNAEQHVGSVHGNQALADGNILNDSTVQKVWNNGKVLNTTLNGNAIQSVFIVSPHGDNASAIHTLLNGSAQQQISGAGAIAENNALKDNTVQSVWNRGKSLNTTLSGNAQQQISGTGTRAEDNILTDNTLQIVWDNGQALNTTLNGNSLQSVSDGASAINTILNDHTQQQITGAGSIADNTIINDMSVQTIGNEGLSKNTTINDTGSVIINGNNALASNILLNGGNVHVINGTARDTTVASSGVLTLEQQGHLYGETILNGGRLIINGSGMAVGSETDVLSVNNNALIQVNGSQNTISNLALDEGYITLTDPFARADSSMPHKQLNINNLTGQGTFLLSVDLATPQGDFVQIQHASGSHGVLVKSSGRNPLSANTLDIIAAKEGNAAFQLQNKGQVVDLGTYQYYLTNSSATGQTVWSLTPNTNSDNGGGSISPSTDAVLSIVSATQFIADGEMQSLRFRHGDLRNNTGSNAGVWGRFLLNDTRIHATEGASYELKQNGMEFGADNVIELLNGKLVLGGLAVFSDNRLEHSRGGQSSINSYGIGGYATYFNESGYYLDTVVKYNRFNDTLNAVMTDGASTSGSYSQNALTTSIEMGANYTLNNIAWVEPYIRGTYFVTDSQNFTLDNGMLAHTGVTRSARVELGSTLGVDYTVDSKTIRPYVRAALENEFIKSNRVTINDTDEFNNDFSGVVGKYGIGISANVSEKANVYAEASYRKGHNLESPIVANLGFRINF